MKKYFVLIICLFSISTHASQRAVTDEGNIVILNEDGTWEYENPEVVKKSDIKINEEIFKKDSKSTFLLKSKKTNSAFWIDPKEWAFKKADDVNQAEYEFQLKGKDLYGMAITEKIEIDLNNLTQLALENAKEAAPDTKITTIEYRMVNNNKVMYMEMVGSLNGIKFKYFGYYYSDSSGSTQYLTYTGLNLVSQGLQGQTLFCDFITSALIQGAPLFAVVMEPIFILRM